MADNDDVFSTNKIKAYPRGSAQGGRAIQATQGAMAGSTGIDGYRTVVRETAEGRAIARTRGGMPMVEVSGGCEIGVDHGAVDLHTLAPLNPDAYKDGNLWFTPYVANHIASTTNPNHPIVDLIEPPEIKGEAPNDGAVAKCLKAGTSAASRDQMYGKKVTMVLCPASIFTGKTRLWVQAMYGRHDDLTGVVLGSSLPSAAPAIMVSGGEGGWVSVTTNTGVYLDKTTGDHWMINVAGNEVSFYPMSVGEDCVDGLKDSLFDPALSAEDQERVETYILADSRPIAKKVQVVPITSTPAYSMGYGWHFNWDGDRCDIVQNNVVAAPVSGHENESIHYRLTFTKSTSGLWSVERTVIEGPTRWKNYKHDFVVCELDWQNMAHEKLGAVHGPTPYGNAPIYAFYARNELNVVRYTCTQSNHDTERVSEPLYFAGNQYGTGGGTYAIGFDPCRYEDSSSWTGLTSTFSCGDVTVGGESGVKLSYGKEMWATAYNQTEPVGLWNAYYLPDYRTDAFQNGYPTTIVTNSNGLYVGGSGLGALTHDTVNLKGSANVYRGSPYANGVLQVFYKDRDMWTRTLCLIPFYDAEACYLYAMTDTVTITTGNEYSTTTATPGYIHKTSPTHVNPVTDGMVVAEAFQAWGDGTWTASSVINETTNMRSGIQQKVISSAGTHDFVLDTTNSFFSETDSVDRAYSFRGSSSGNSAYAKTMSVKVGFPDAIVDTPFAFVGWA